MCPDPTTRRPLFAASTRLARGVAVVAPRPDLTAPYSCGGGAAFPRPRHASLSAWPNVGGAAVSPSPSPSLCPRPTARHLTLAAKARLARRRGLVAVARPRCRRHRCAPAWRPALAAEAWLDRGRGCSTVAVQKSPGPIARRSVLAATVACSRRCNRCAASFPRRRGRVTVAVVAPPPDRAVTCPRNGGAACLHPRRESQSARPHGSGAAASTIDNEHVSTSYFVSGF